MPAMTVEEFITKHREKLIELGSEALVKAGYSWNEKFILGYYKRVAMLPGGRKFVRNASDRVALAALWNQVRVEKPA